MVIILPSPFVFYGRKKFIQICNNMRMTNWWQDPHFWVSYPFKTSKIEICPQRFLPQHNKSFKYLHYVQSQTSLCFGMWQVWLILHKQVWLILHKQLFYWLLMTGHNRGPSGIPTAYQSFSPRHTLSHYTRNPVWRVIIIMTIINVMYTDHLPK